MLSIEEDVLSDAMRQLTIDLKNYFVPGLEQVSKELKEIIWFPFVYSAEMIQRNIKWPTGVLIHGPTGCGKSFLIDQVVKQVNAKLVICFLILCLQFLLLISLLQLSEKLNIS